MISVLIVDDHALFRAGLRCRLELEQDITSVGEAATAEEAVSKARSLQQIGRASCRERVLYTV